MTGKYWYLAFRAPTGRPEEPFEDKRVQLKATTFDGALAEAKVLWSGVESRKAAGIRASDMPFGKRATHPEVVFRMPLLLE